MSEDKNLREKAKEQIVDAAVGSNGVRTWSSDPPEDYEPIDD